MHVELLQQDGGVERFLVDDEEDSTSVEGPILDGSGDCVLQLLEKDFIADDQRALVDVLEQVGAEVVHHRLVRPCQFGEDQVAAYFSKHLRVHDNGGSLCGSAGAGRRQLHHQFLDGRGPLSWRRVVHLETDIMLEKKKKNSLFVNKTFLVSILLEKKLCVLVIVHIFFFAREKNCYR